MNMMKSPIFENESESPFNYGFKTRKCPPQYKDLMEFEDDVQESVITFKIGLRMT